MDVGGLATPPAYLSVPEQRCGSKVEQVAALSEAIGTPMDDEQRLAVDVATSVRADGRPAALESAIITCRQNLKTFCGERVALARLLEPVAPKEPGRLLLWSAHEFRTAQETFLHFDELVSGFSFLSRRVLAVSRGNGEEEFRFKGGHRLMFRARIRTGGRGLTGDDLFLDEAFALVPAHLGSLLPTLSTRRNARVYYLSSSGLAASAVLRGVRDRGRAGGRGAPAYVEWCAPGSLRSPGCSDGKCQHRPGTPGCVLDDEGLWVAANPAIRSGRIDLEFVRAERLALPPEEFARERLGWWDDPEDALRPISAEQWAAAEVEADPAAPPPSGQRAFFVDVSPGMASASVAVAIATPAGPHVELVDARPGTAWLVERCAEVARRNSGAAWAGDASSGVAALAPDFQRAGFEIDLWPPSELGRACGHLERLARDGGWSHAADHRLSVALEAAVRRDVGDGLWAWARRKTSADISSLVAETGALWLLEKQPARAAVEMWSM